MLCWLIHSLLHCPIEPWTSWISYMFHCVTVLELPMLQRSHLRSSAGVSPLWGNPKTAGAERLYETCNRKFWLHPHPPDIALIYLLSSPSSYLVNTRATFQDGLTWPSAASPALCCHFCPLLGSAGHSKALVICGGKSQASTCPGGSLRGVHWGLSHICSPH